jgi:Bardet-Biedl syndrome 7 protein
MNAMRISGDFAFDDAHAWIGRCLDEIPVRVSPPEAGGEIVYDFESALMGTLLRASVQEGDVTFWSDSVTPLALLKEYIGREATNLKLRVRFNFDLADATPTHFAELLHPKLHANRELTKQARLVEAMKEIKQQEETDEFFTEEQKQMLRDEDVIKRRIKRAAEGARLPDRRREGLLRGLAQVQGREREARAAVAGRGAEGEGLFPGEAVHDLRERLGIDAVAGNAF